MPIPTPNENETKEEFMSRCMSSETMAAEYPEEDQRIAVCEVSFDGKRHDIGKALGGTFKHTSEVSISEMPWEDVDRSKLPLDAFVWEAKDTKSETKSTWKYPHHWIENGKSGEDGIYSSGTMYLHKKGLEEAISSANSSGQNSKKEVLDHLEKHRKELEQGKSIPEVMHFKVNAEPQMSVEEEAGTISGYASVWDVTDQQGDIMRKGAFNKSIKERVAAGKVPLMAKHFAHGGDVNEAIGVITEAREDEHGLYISAKLYKSQMAQEIRSKVMESPNMYGLSVGFMQVKNGSKKIKTGYEFSEVKLYEVTVTAMPAVEQTNAIAKTAYQDELEKMRAELESVRQMVVDLQSKSSPSDTEQADTHEQEPESTEPEGKAASHSNAARINLMKRELAVLEMEKCNDV